MDQSLNIPYYFPPQRYIPKLGNFGGGSRGGAPSAASGAMEGLSEFMKMFIELRESRDIKKERLKDKADALAMREGDKKQSREDQQERRQWHQEDLTEAQAGRGARTDEADSARLERGGAFLMPGAMGQARTAGAAKQPIAPDTVDITSPEGAESYAGGLQAGAQRGQQDLNTATLAGVQAADSTGKVQPIGPGGQYGFARKPPQDERNSIYALQAADRRDANAIHLHTAWATRRANSVRDQMSKEYPTPYAEMLPEDQARHDARRESLLQEYSKYDPEPTLPGLPVTQPRNPAQGQDQPDAARLMIRNWIKNNMPGANKP